MFVKLIIQPNFLEISTTYGVVIIIIHVCLLADNSLISSLHTQCIISKSNVKLCSMQQYECHYFLQYNVYNMIHSTSQCWVIKVLVSTCIISLGHLPLITTTLIIPDVTKTLSNNCLL